MKKMFNSYNVNLQAINNCTFNVVIAVPFNFKMDEKVDFFSLNEQKGDKT